ncbi:MAG: methyl-accepting chemotaxis protein [Clostridiales bacterium]|jgi:methyl-accepting chemotaxis protein|nr:methyl-accepting chemotaxis protein [Clostridiales bacterium]
MKLRNKILLPVILVLAVVVTAISVINYLITKNAVNEMIDTEMEAAISNVVAAERLSSEIIGLVMGELDAKNLSLSRALAEIVRLNPDALETEEMVRLAELLDVTEVHVVDENGVLWWGNIPGYYGFDFASGEQTIPFLQILQDPTYELAQEPQPNATLGLMFQYTGVARTDADGLVQVGIEAGIIDAMKTAMSVQKTVANTKVGRSGYCFIVENGTVTASGDVSQIGMGFAPSAARQTGSGMWFTQNGGEYYANSRDENGKTVYAVIPRQEFYETLNTLAVSSVIISAAAIIFMALIVTVILRRITRPMEELNRKLIAAAEGDLGVAVAMNTRDEVGQLSVSMSSVLEIFNKLTADMGVMSRKINTEGEVDYKIDDSQYSGDYKKVVSGINEMMKLNNEDTLHLLAALQKLGEGDFGVKYAELPGKKAVYGKTVEGLRKNLKDIDSEIRQLSEAAIRGELNARADAGKYKGDWAALLSELNTLVKSIADKANWYESLLDGIPTPVFSTDADMNWTFVNKACEEMIGRKRHEVVGLQCSSFGTVICGTGNCAINNFKKGIKPTRFSQDGKHYEVNVADVQDDNGKITGFVEFISDTTDMNEIIHNLNELVANIKIVSAQVTNGAKQIAENSQHLAAGAVSQSSSIEELDSSLVMINEKTKVAAQNASNASELSMNAKENAIVGNEQMKRMVSAMEGIKGASDNISRIIKAIEDIAFQTNMLAINAAVEAARAGEHGKGFAVVAEEVRNLAARSQAAAKETNDLIFESLNRVENGTTIAASTAQSLTTIVSDSDAVSKLIDEIARAASEQAESVNQISEGIKQISDITMQNSASSEETAAASQELSSQAEILKDMVSNF